MSNNSKPQVLHSVLDSHLRMYADTNRFLAYAIKDKDFFDITQIGCNGDLESCTSKNSLGVKATLEQREIACKNCSRIQSSIFSNNRICIDSYEICESKKIFFQNLNELVCSDRNLTRAIGLKFEGIEFCKIAFFDWSILFKLGINNILDDNQLNRFLQGVKDLLKIYQAIQENNLIDDNFLYLLYINGNYSQNTFLRLILAKKLVKAISIEPQPFTNKLFNKICFKKDRVELRSYGLIDVKLSDGFVDSSSLKEVLSTFRSRFLGKEYNAYTSLKKNAQIKLEINTLNEFTKQFGKIHTYFAHSSDEVIPHVLTHNAKAHNSTDVFHSQEEFIDWLIGAARDNPKIGYVIRLHPRMASNKRDGFESEEHIRIQKILNHEPKPDNLLVIWGDSKISSYYVLFKSSLVLVGWSTIGLEALVLGKSVISIFPNFGMYPISDVSLQPKSSVDLKEAIIEPKQYGSPLDINLAIWISTSYEYQFGKIPVIRTIGSASGIFLHIISRLLIRAHLSDWWFKFFSWINFYSLLKDDDLFYKFKNEINPLSNDQISKIFKFHKKCWELKMVNYEKK